MYSPEPVMQPSGFRAIDEVGDYVKRMRVGKLRVHNVRNSFVIEEDL